MVLSCLNLQMLTLLFLVKTKMGLFEKSTRVSKSFESSSKIYPQRIRDLLLISFGGT